MTFLLLLSLPVNDYRVIQGLYRDGMYELAEKQAEIFINKYPAEKFTPDVCVILLNSMFKMKKYNDVVNNADGFIRRYPVKREAFLKIKGDALIKLARFEEAIKTYSKLKEKGKYLYIGDAYYYMNDYRKAIEYYSKVKGAYANLSAGWCYYKMGEYEKAYDTFSLVKDDKFREEAEYMMGKCLLKMNKKDAVQYLEDFLRRYPESKYRERVFFSIAQYLQNKGDSKGAKSYYKKLISLNPPYRELGLTNMGIIYYKEGKYDSSMYYLEQVPVTSPYFGDALYYIGCVKVAKGEKLDGITILRQVMEDYPELKDYAGFKIGEVLEGMGKIQNAIDYYLKVKGKKMGKALIRAGDLLLKTKPDSAISLYKRAVSEGEKDLGILKTGIALYKQEKYRDCVRYLESNKKDVKEPLTNQRVNLLIGDAYLKIKNYKEAEKYYSIVLSKGDRRTQAYAMEGLGWVYTGLKDYKNAYKILDRLQKKYPEFRGRGSLYLTLGDVAFAMGDFNRAENLYKRVKGNWQPEAMFRLGKLYMGMGKYRMAAKTFLNLRKKYSVYEKSDLALYLAGVSLRKAHDLYSSTAQLKSLVKGAVSKELKEKATLIIGNNFFDSAEYDSAIYYYEKNLDYFPAPDTGMYPAIRGILYSEYKRGRHIEDRGRDFIRKMKASGLEDGVKYIIGEIFLSSGEYKNAEKYLKETNTPEAKLLLADIYIKTGRDKKGIEMLEALIKNEKFLQKAGHRLFDYYINNGEYNNALDLAEKMKNNLYKVKALIGMKKYSEAITLAKKIEGCEGMLLRGISLLGLDKENGLNSLDSAAGCSETAARAIYEKSLYLFKKGKNVEEDLLKVRYLYPESDYYSPSMVLLAKAFLKEGKKKEAIKILQDVIKRKDRYEKEARSILNSIH